MAPRVSLVAEGDRFRAVTQALGLLADAPLEKAAKAARIVVKPNFVSTYRPLSATHVDAARAVLEYILPAAGGEVLIAEGSAHGSTERAYEDYGYRELCDEYGLEFRDLNFDDTRPFSVLDDKLNKVSIKVARTLLESDFRISVSPPKTHDTVAVTLSIKNAAMGAPQKRSGPLARTLNRFCGSAVRDDKWAVHRGCAATHLNLFLLSRVALPHLAVLDGHTAMEGNGPIYGTPVDWGIALASEDAVALDFTCARMMGVEPTRIGYLYYCARAGLGNPDDIEMVGADPAKHSREFTLHDTADAHFWWDVPEDELAELGLFS
ncbi:MAG: DUF362 domain-containing protein [Candidatus Coatesbacteria bacterium]|nr:MAG: DUF362 domain-containing protein [Candidatus Coatesbacteria bacterium]